MNWTAGPQTSWFIDDSAKYLYPSVIDPNILIKSLTRTVTPMSLYPDVGRIKPIDALGEEIKVGDYVSYPAQDGSRSAIRIGRVAKITYKKDTKYDSVDGRHCQGEFPKIGVFALERNWHIVDGIEHKNQFDFNPHVVGFERRPMLPMKNMITLDNPSAMIIINDTPVINAMKNELDAAFPSCK